MRFYKFELKEIVNNVLPKEIVAFLNTDVALFMGVARFPSRIAPPLQTLKPISFFSSSLILSMNLAGLALRL